MNSKTQFPNLAGNISNVDDIIRKELVDAGIIINEFSYPVSDGEVKTKIIGTLYSWTFTRAWVYYICSGSGIDVETAEKLHKEYGTSVRVSGHCGCPSPREWYKGLGCGLYHVDDQEGLKALADTIKEIIKKNEK